MLLIKLQILLMLSFTFELLIEIPFPIIAMKDLKNSQIWPTHKLSFWKHQKCSNLFKFKYQLKLQSENQVEEYSCGWTAVGKAKGQPLSGAPVVCTINMLQS